MQPPDTSPERIIELFILFAISMGVLIFISSLKCFENKTGEKDDTTPE